MRIDVWDDNRREERHFDVVPNEPGYVAMCCGKMHQFHRNSTECGCGAVQRLLKAGPGTKIKVKE